MSVISRMSTDKGPTASPLSKITINGSDGNSAEELVTSMHSPEQEIALIQDETASGVSLFHLRDDPPEYRRSRNIDATVQASIQQALALGPELMWHSNYVRPDDEKPTDAQRDVASLGVQRRASASESGFVLTNRSRGNAQSRRIRQSSNCSRPHLYRRITNDSSAGPPLPRGDNDLWADFLRGKPSATPTGVTSATWTSHQQQRVQQQQHYNELHNECLYNSIPRHVDISDKFKTVDADNDIDEDAISGLDNDDDDAASLSSVSTTILNDFLYGDAGPGCRQKSSGDDNDDCDDNSSVPSVVMDDWAKKVAI